MRRLLWCGKDRCDKLQLVCHTLQCIYNALNIFDRFHIAKKFNEAGDRVRRDKVKEFKDAGNDNVLEKAKYILPKRPENHSEKQSGRLEERVEINLLSIKEYLLKEDFQAFWSMRCKSWSGKFLED